MKHTASKINEIRKHLRTLALIIVPAVALILGAFAPEARAEDELEFADTEFNIEFNSSDEDLGVRGFVDGEPWKELEIENPKGRTIAEIEAKKRMAKQGYAELFFESGEPTLAKVPIKKFLKRFPEGTYEFEGETTKGQEIEGEAEFTHVIPCGPDPTINAVVGGGNVTITWSEPNTVVDLDNTVSGSVVCIGPAPTIVGYEVILEGDGSELTFKLDAEVIPSTQLIIPLSLLEDGIEYKFEVIAIEESGNQTITESFFNT